MAITVPWTARLTRLEDLRDAAFDAVGTHVAGKMGLVLATGVDPGKRQQIIGFVKMLEAVYHDRNGFETTGDHYVRGDYLNGDKGSITIDTTAPAAGQVGFSISGTFYTAGTPAGNQPTTLWFDETANQLRQAFLLQSVDN